MYSIIRVWLAFVGFFLVLGASPIVITVTALMFVVAFLFAMTLIPFRFFEQNAGVVADEFSEFVITPVLFGRDVVNDMWSQFRSITMSKAQSATRMEETNTATEHRQAELARIRIRYGRQSKEMLDAQAAEKRTKSVRACATVAVCMSGVLWLLIASSFLP